MKKTRMRYFTVVLAALLIMVLLRPTMGIVKADTEITPSAENEVPILESTEEVTSESTAEITTEITSEATAEITDILSETTDQDTEVSTETEIPNLTEIPTLTETPLVTDIPTVTLTPEPTATQTPEPTPTEADTTPPNIVLSWSNPDYANEHVTLQIVITDDSSIITCFGQLIGADGNARSLGFEGSGNQYTSNMVLGNGDYHLLITATDLAGNTATKDEADVSVQMHSIN